MATVGTDGEAARLIGVDLIHDVVGLHEDEVGHGVGWFLQRGLRWGD